MAAGEGSAAASQDTASPTGSWIGEVLDAAGDWKVRSRAPYVLGLLMLFDSWDSTVIAYLLPSITAEWHLSKLQIGWLVSAGYGGQFIGAILFGALSERYGRLPLLLPLFAVMSVLAIACALANGLTMLLVLRLVQGIAIGGAVPIGISYVNEVAPTATRGRFFGTFQFLMASGYGFASLVSIWVVPHYGWRVMFALGAMPLLIIPFARFLPESPRWLGAKGREAAAQQALLALGSGPLPDAAARAARPVPVTTGKVPLGLLLASDVRRKSLITAALWFLTYLVNFGLLTWIVSIYVSMFHIPVAEALSYNSIVAVSVFGLPLLLRATIDRFGRRPPAILAMVTGGIGLLLACIIPAENRVLLVSAVITGQLGVSVGALMLWPYTAEIYATRVRSLALGTASSLARGASMLTPLLVGGMLQLSGSAVPVFAAFGVACFLVALLWWRGAEETAGRAISD